MALRAQLCDDTLRMLLVRRMIQTCPQVDSLSQRTKSFFYRVWQTVFRTFPSFWADGLRIPGRLPLLTFSFVPRKIDDGLRKGVVELVHVLKSNMSAYEHSTDGVTSKSLGTLKRHGDA